MSERSTDTSRRTVLKTTGASLLALGASGVASANHKHPSVTTESGAPAGSTAVTLNCELHDLGEGADYANVWFQWELDSGDGFPLSTDKQALSSPDTYSATVDGLREGETIYFRAVAEDEDDGDRDYGTVRSASTFMTKP